MRKSTVGVLILLLAASVGCEGIGTAAQRKDVQGGLLGSALGAGAGAIIGNQTGHAGSGAAVGAGLGALGGALVGNAMSERDRTSQPAPAAVTGSKFCPVGGELYSEDIKYCPKHGVELKYKE